VRGHNAAAARQVPGALAIQASAPSSERGRCAKVWIANHRWRWLEVGLLGSLAIRTGTWLEVCIECSVQEGYGPRDGRLLRPKVRSPRN
jgi:hypothetical protein